jgi:hypothetical protein
LVSSSLNISCNIIPPPPPHTHHLPNTPSENYRSCINDCASTLRLNPKNIKALYRSTTACLALDKLPEALDACTIGLAHDPTNASLTALHAKISARQTYLAQLEAARTARLEKEASQRATLALALRARGIATRTSTADPPELEDAAVQLADPADPSSNLTFPVLLLYPMHGQSDFVKAFGERETLGTHLEYIFPLPWDGPGEYTVDGVEAYMETTGGKGLIKVGKKMKLHKVLGSGKTEVVDGLVRISVVPKDKAQGWIDEFKKRVGKV